MDLKKYFAEHEGLGVLATSSEQGWVDTALYARPYVVDESTVAFVMKERLSHQNLKSNIHASYLFIENPLGYQGLRLYLTLIREEINQSLAAILRQQQPVIYPAGDDSNKYVVFFRVDCVRPLVGDDPPQEPDL